MAMAYLEMKEIRKSFDGNVALKNASISVNRGEVHALVGENGSGKTTLMNILGGVTQATSGDIFINGEKVKIENTQQAMNLNIATVFQSDSLFNNLNIAENVFANREIKTKMGIVDWRAIYQKTEEALKYLDIEVSANTPVSKLTVAERKMVEIARALISGAKIVVMDEPTTVFADSETEKMYEVIRHLKQANVALIYISHRLREIPKIADEITILREGESIATIDKKEFEKINIFEVMIGSKVKDRFPKIHVDIKEEVLIVNEIKNQYLKDITFSVRKGEILGIAGLKGSGRTSLARVLFGLDHIDKGAIYIEGEKIRSSDTESASELGISFIPANRFDKGTAAERKC